MFSPWIFIGTIALSLAHPSVQARSSDNVVAYTVNQLVRQFTLRTTVAQVNHSLQGFVTETGGKLRGVPMQAGASNFPADMGTVPNGFIQRDGAGRPLGYCAWDNNAISDGGGFLAGSAISNPMVYAVISTGVNGVMETSCANIAS